MLRIAFAAPALACAFAPLAPAAGQAGAGDPARQLDALEIQEPEPRLQDAAQAEVLAADVARGLAQLAQRLRARDLRAAREWLAPGFAGPALGELAVEKSEGLRLGGTRTTFAPASARAADAAGFTDGLVRLLGSWSLIESVHLDVVDAAFAAPPERGAVRVALHATGEDAGGDPVGLAGELRCEVQRQDGVWKLARARLESLRHVVRRGRIFSDVSAAAGMRPSGDGGALRAWGAAAGDVDGDDRHRTWDLFVAGAERNYLYVAQRDGTFREQAEARGVAQPGGGAGALFLDFDNDSDQDLIVASAGWVGAERKGAPVRVYVNDGAGRFEESGARLGFGTPRSFSSLTAFDYDRDGWIDIYACADGPGEAARGDAEARSAAPNALFKNLAGKGFEDVAERAGVANGRRSFGAAAVDYDFDGSLDLYVANELGNRLYKSNGDGTFSDFARKLDAADGGLCRGAAFADLDNDARVDIYLARGAPGAPATARGGGNGILMHRGGEFALVAAEAGGQEAGSAFSPLVVDLNLDGLLDVFCTNGSAPGEAPARACAPFVGRSDRLWLNRGNAWFEDLSDVSGSGAPLAGRAAVAVDCDDDGDLDLFVHGAEGRHALYRNELGTAYGGFIKVQLMATKSHYEAAGATVLVRGPDGESAQVLSRGSGFQSCQPPELVFGIAEARSVQVDVIWPGGIFEGFSAVPRGARVLLVEGTGKLERLNADPRPLPDPAPPGVRVPEGTQLPPLAALDAAGGSAVVDTRSPEGLPVHLCLWASTCEPSLAALSALEAKRAAGEARVVALCVDPPADRAAAAQRFAELGTGISTCFLGDVRAEIGAVDARTLIDLERLPIPTTLVLTPEGVLVQIVRGALTRDG